MKFDEYRVKCEAGEVACITEHRSFDSVCLDEFVLEMAYLGYRQMYGQMQGNQNEFVIFL